MISTSKPWKLEALAKAVQGGDLKPNPEYQRGAKWGKNQQRGLIDSLLRDYHIPLFYIHVTKRTTSFGETNTVRWVIDGQQRLNAITGYLNGDFALEDVNSDSDADGLYRGRPAPGWAGKKLDELEEADRARLLGRELLVVELTETSDADVADLFVRLQGGTPLNAQEKRDAWPGEFTNFVIRHAGKAGHRLSSPHPFFAVLKKKAAKKQVDDDEGFHYIDRDVDGRKLMAQIAMTIMRREREDESIDVVDVNAKALNSFYIANLQMNDADPAVVRVLRTLTLASKFPGFQDLPKQNSNLVLHFALLADSLLRSDAYVQDWYSRYCPAFIAFLDEMAEAKLQYKEDRTRSAMYNDFIVPLAGSGSDTKEVIRQRHAFFSQWMHGRLKVKLKDPLRLYGILERQVVWARDGKSCQNPSCARPDVPFDETTVHHVVEHSEGGPTVLKNAVMVCKACAPKRKELQAAQGKLLEYLKTREGT